MLIVYSDPGGGWGPVTYMVKLAAELLEAEVLLMDEDSTKWSSFQEKLELILLRRSKNQNQNQALESCLLICPNPSYLLMLASVKNWRRRFRFVGAWIIDSFWLEDLPWSIKVSRLFDFFFVTSQEDIPGWQQATGTETIWLPWGTDVLRLGGGKAERSCDLIRVGRQPPTWDDDSETEVLCRAHQLSFQGRPKAPGTIYQGFEWATENQKMLMNLYQQSKFMLAFSNIVNPTNYTHPSRDYITARWVDSLASGAIVAGVAPESPSVKELLWSSATLDLGSTDRNKGIEIITEAVQHWQPKQALENYHYALKRLDWRWRFAKIAEVFHESPQRLDAELQVLRATIDQNLL